MITVCISSINDVTNYARNKTANPKMLYQDFNLFIRFLRLYFADAFRCRNAASLAMIK